MSTQLARSRALRSWSQADLAKRAKVSRTEISAIENSRVVPSVATAISLARALGESVESLFNVRSAEASQRAMPKSGRFWEAELAGRTDLFQVEATPIGEVAHDGVVVAEAIRRRVSSDPFSTLVLAGCDPAVGLLASEMTARQLRLLPLQRSSEAALRLLGEGSVHVAGLHVTDAAGRPANRRAVRDLLGTGYRLVRVATWWEGVAYRPNPRRASLRQLNAPSVRWAAREPGSGARACLDRLLGEMGRPRRFRRTARDHRMVAEVVRTGWADAGVCVQIVAEESGLDFAPVQAEEYDLCFAADLSDDHRMVALLRVLRSRPFRELLADLPGYDAPETGEVEDV